jgi:Domain of Unknown Function (DUF1080)
MNHLLIVCSTAALVVPGIAADMDTPRSLFNGKDLSGWHGEGYVVEDGAIVCTPEGKNLTTDATFANYILEFDFQLPAGGNNGLGFHYPDSDDGTGSGMELQILDNSAEKYKDLQENQLHGSLYKLVAAKKTGLKPVGEWNHQRVSVLGPALLVELNGEMILRSNLDDLSVRNPTHKGVRSRSGHIAWLGHGERVAFRNIQITEKSLPANVESVLSEGFVRLHNGKNLDGWKHEGNPEWTVSHGILKHSGKAGTPPHLWTEKEYGDCTLVFDWRWSGKGPMKKNPIILPDGSEQYGADGKSELKEVEEQDSGIFLRGSEKSQVNLWNWNIGSGEVYGYRTNLELPAEIRAGVTPKMKADRPIGQWNRTLITIKGDRLTVNMNNRVVIDHAQLPGVPTKGAIGLQHHGSAVDFANIWIKEL